MTSFMDDPRQRISMALRRMTILGQTSIIAVRGVLLPLLLAYDLSIILALPGAIRSIFYACVVKGDFFSTSTPCASLAHGGFLFAFSP